MVRNFCCHSNYNQSTSTENFISHPDEQFDQNMFVLSISTFIMTPLMSCSSNTMIDKN